MRDFVIGSLAFLSACNIAYADITANMRYDGRSSYYAASGEVTNPIPVSELHSMIPEGEKSPRIPFDIYLKAAAGERLTSAKIWSLDSPVSYQVSWDESDPEPVECVIDIFPDQNSRRYLHWHTFDLDGFDGRISGCLRVNPDLVDFIGVPDIGLAVRVEYTKPNPDDPDDPLRGSAEFVYHAPVIKEEHPVVVEKSLVGASGFSPELSLDESVELLSQSSK